MSSTALSLFLLRELPFSRFGVYTMQLKHAVLALAAAGMLSAQAHASEMQVETAIQPTQPAAFTEADMAALFDNAHQPMQLAALSDQEMKETEGAWLNLAIGGVIGLGSYAYSNWGDMTWSGALASTALGAIGGYGVGVAGLRVLGPYANTGGFGIALGRPGITNMSRWYGNSNQFGRIDFHRSNHSPFIHTHRGGWLR